MTTYALVERVAYKADLTLSVVKEGKSGEELLLYPLVSLTWLILALWNIKRYINYIHYDLYCYRIRLGEYKQLGGIITAIAFNAICYGLKVDYGRL